VTTETRLRNLGPVTGLAPAGRRLIQASTSSALLEESSRGELGSAECSNGDSADAQKSDPPFDNDLDNAGVPASIDRTSARYERGTVRTCEPARFLGRTSRRSERPERHRSGGKGRRIRSSRRLETPGEGEANIGQADGEHQDEAGDGKEQDRRGTPLLAHRSTRIAERAVTSTANPPKSGAATR